MDKSLVKSKDKQQSQYHAKTNVPVSFKIHGLVSLEVLRDKSGQARKFVPKFQGPYRVIGKSGTTHAYVLNHMCKYF